MQLNNTPSDSQNVPSRDTNARENVIGRDIHVYGDDVHGDKIEGDKNVYVISYQDPIAAQYQKKQEILDRVNSPVRDVAVHAFWEARNNNFLNEALQIANFIGRELDSIDLSGANLQQRNLKNSELQKAKFRNASLQGANLRGVKAQFALFTNADLQYAYLNHARLEQAVFNHANLHSADLRGVYLQGATLIGANLQDADLRLAIYDVDTIWPENFNPKVAGAIKVKRDVESGNWVSVDEIDNQS